MKNYKSYFFIVFPLGKVSNCVNFLVDSLAYENNVLEIFA